MAKGGSFVMGLGQTLKHEFKAIRLTQTNKEIDYYKFKKECD
jgi:hypothetical protein